MNNEEQYRECIRLMNQAIELLDKSYQKARETVYIDWWIYNTSLERNRGFHEFKEQCYPSCRVRHLQKDVTFSDTFMVKFVTTDDIMMGVEFGDNDTVYLKSEFTTDSALKILSRMRGIENAQFNNCESNVPEERFD